MRDWADNRVRTWFREALSRDHGRYGTDTTLTSKRLGSLFGVLLVVLAVFAGVVPIVDEASAANHTIDSCTTITSPGSYELTDTVTASNTSACVEIAASDVTLDGNGNTVDGYSNNTIGSDGSADEISGSTGVRVAGTDSTRVRNVTIQNVAFESGRIGINATHASNVEIVGVTVANASLQAIDVHEVDESVTIRNVETVNSPQYSESSAGNTARTRAAIDVGPGPTRHDAAPDRVTVTNLRVDDSPQNPTNDPAVEVETDGGPITVTDSSIVATPRGGLELDANGGNGTATVRNVRISDYGQETVDEEGLTVLATADITISSTTLINGATGSKMSEHAVFARSDSGGVDVADSTVRNVASEEAIDIDASNTDSQEGVVRNVTVHNNTGGPGDNGGVVATIGGRLDVRDVSITQTGNGWAGSFSGAPVDIRNLSVDHTAERGVQVSSFEEATTMRDSVVSNLRQRQNSVGPGLEVTTAEGTFRNITVSDMAGPGLSLEETDGGATDTPLTLTNSTVENVGGDGVALAGNQLTVRDTSIVDAGGAGLTHDDDASDPLGVSIRNLSVRNTGDDGIRITEDSTSSSDDLRLTDVTATNASGDEFRVTTVSATLDGLDVSSAVLDGTARSVVINSSPQRERPTPPSDREDIDAYFRADGTTPDGYLDATVRYDQSAVPAGLDASTLELWRYNGSWVSNGGTVDTAVNTVSANLTEFSVFAPLGSTNATSMADFDLAIDSTNSPVNETETLTVDATVTNTGQRAGTETITLSAGGDDRDAETVTLDAGNATEISLSWNTTTGDAGNYTAKLSSPNTTAESANVTVTGLSSRGDDTGTSNETTTQPDSGGSNTSSPDGSSGDSSGESSESSSDGSSGSSSDGSSGGSSDGSSESSSNGSSGDSSGESSESSSDGSSGSSSSGSAGSSGGSAGGSGGDGGSNTDTQADDDEDRLTTTLDNGTVSQIENSTAVFGADTGVSRVTFDEDTDGGVVVETYAEPPASVVDAITRTATDGDSAPDQTTTVTVVSAVDISPSESAAEQSSARVTFEIDDAALSDPDDAVIFHETDSGWVNVSTSVERTGNDTVRLAGDIDSFSLFAVVIVESQESATPVTPTSTPAATPTDTSVAPDIDETATPSSSTGLFGFGQALFVTLLAAAVGTIAFRHRSSRR